MSEEHLFAFDVLDIFDITVHLLDKIRNPYPHFYWEVGFFVKMLRIAESILEVEAFVDKLSFVDMGTSVKMH